MGSIYFETAYISVKWNENSLNQLLTLLIKFNSFLR